MPSLPQVHCANMVLWDRGGHWQGLTPEMDTGHSNLLCMGKKPLGCSHHFAALSGRADAYDLLQAQSLLHLLQQRLLLQPCSHSTCGSGRQALPRLTAADMLATSQCTPWHEHCHLGRYATAGENVPLGCRASNMWRNDCIGGFQG